MRVTAVLTVVMLLVPAGRSGATPRPVPGPLTGCSYVTGTTQNADPTRIAGELYGYVAAVDVPSAAGAATANPVALTLTCSLQSSSVWHVHPDDFAASASGSGVAVLAPVPFSVPRPAEEWPLAVCSRVDVTDAGGTRTYYSNSQNSTWSTSPYATCSGAPQCLAYSPDCVWYLGLLFALFEIADELTCAELAARAPGIAGVVDIQPGGDAYVLGEFVWDCPPYADWGGAARPR